MSILLIYTAPKWLKKSLKNLKWKRNCRILNHYILNLLQHLPVPKTTGCNTVNNYTKAAKLQLSNVWEYVSNSTGLSTVYTVCSTCKLSHIIGKMRFWCGEPDQHQTPVWILLRPPAGPPDPTLNLCSANSLCRWPWCVTYTGQVTWWVPPSRTLDSSSGTELKVML